jgi:transcriptional regulator with XRE-family HTH domain
MSADMSRVAIHLGRNLRSLRKRAGISQEDLSRLASLHRTEIGLLERGERLPRVDTLIKLAGALSMAPGTLFSGIHWKPENVRPGGFEFRDLGDVEQ